MKPKTGYLSHYYVFNLLIIRDFNNKKYFKSSKSMYPYLLDWDIKENIFELIKFIFNITKMF